MHYRQCEGVEEPKPQPLPTHAGQRRVWLLFEHPESSIYAHGLALWSVGVTLLSIFVFCLETLPRFKPDKTVILQQYNGTFFNDTYRHNSSYIVNVTSSSSSSGPSSSSSGDTPTTLGLTIQHFHAVETCCIIWFCFELLVRFISCPDKRLYFCNAMNVIDVIAIAPYFVSLIESTNENSTGAGRRGEWALFRQSD